MSKTTMVMLASAAFVIAALASLEARTTVVLPIAFGVIGLALGVRALMLWQRERA